MAGCEGVFWEAVGDEDINKKASKICSNNNNTRHHQIIIIINSPHPFIQYISPPSPPPHTHLSTIPSTPLIPLLSTNTIIIIINNNTNFTIITTTTTSRPICSHAFFSPQHAASPSNHPLHKPLVKSIPNTQLYRQLSHPASSSITTSPN